MPTNKNKITKTDILEVKVDQLQEDVMEIRDDIKVIKKDIKAINTKIDDMEVGLGNKLDKILKVVTDQHTSLSRRVTHLEHHTTHPPLAVAV